MSDQEQHCSLCTLPAEVFCSIGSCAPGSWFCGYHYEQQHLPESERDEPAEMFLCPYCGAYHSIASKEWYCPRDPHRIQ